MDKHENQDERPLLAQVVSTGDEVLTGAVVDSNSAFIASALLETGLRVVRHTTVGDDTPRLRQLLREIGEVADIAVVTGGLGPTVDDVTTRAAAEAAGVKQVENPEALAAIQDYFKGFSKEMAISDGKQAFLPENAEPILNRSGTAPGFKMNIGKCAFFFLPGVPREMKKMMVEMVIPAIVNDYIPLRQRQYYRERQLSIFGLPEAEVDQRLVEPSKKFGIVKLGMLARFPIIIVKLFAFGDNVEKIDRQIGEAVRLVEAALGHWIFSDTGETIETAVANMLKKHSATLAVAESCTGGLIADKLTNVPGASAFFLMSAVSYANTAKTDILGVLPETIEQFGAVSDETAKEMAEGVRRISGADYGVSTSGIAGPSGGTDEKPVGTICVAVAGPRRTVARRRVLSFRDRCANKEIFAHLALDLLRRELIEPGLE